MKTIEETHPSLIPFTYIKMPRSNLNSRTLAIFEGKLQKHTVDKAVLKEVLNRIIKESEEPYATGWVEGSIEKIKEELVLED